MGYSRGDLRYIGPGENVFVFIPNLIGYARVVRIARRSVSLASCRASAGLGPEPV